MMTNFAINRGTGGISDYPHQDKMQMSAKGAQSQLNSADLNSYDNLVIWQYSTQKTIEQNVENEMMAVSDDILLDEDKFLAKYEEVYNKQASLAEDFSFMTEEEKSYGEQLDDLVQGHIERHDTDGDDKISLEEFKQREMYEYNIEPPEGGEPITEDNEIAMQMYETAFKFMDLNGDNLIDADEVKTYYMTADILDNANNQTGNNQDMMDGNIKFSSMLAIQDTMSIEGEESSVQNENRETLKASMTAIYNEIKTETSPADPQNQDEVEEDNEKGKDDPAVPAIEPEKVALVAQEPTAEGKMIMAIEKRILSENLFAD